MTLDIPTSVNRAELATLERLSYGRNVLEFGSLLGASTVTMAQRAQSVTAVDRHTGYGPDTWHSFLRNIHRYGVQDRVRPVRASIDLALDISGRFDIGFIDLMGSRAITALALWKMAHIPIVAVHDVTRIHCTADRALLTCGRLPLEHIDTLVVLGPVNWNLVAKQRSY